MLNLFKKIDSNFKEILKNSTIAFLLKLISVFISYLFSFIVVKLLGAKAWGIFALAFGLLQIFSMIGRLGFETYLLETIAKYNISYELRKRIPCLYLKSIKILSVFSLFISFFIFLVSWTPFSFLAKINKPYLLPMLKLVSISILPFSLLIINSESLRALKKIKESIFLSGIFPYIFSLLLLLIFTAFNKNSILMPFTTFFMGVILSLILSFFYIYKFRILSKDSFNFQCRIQIPFYLYAINILFLVIPYIDIAFLATFKTIKDVGIYNIVTKLTNLINFVLFSVNAILAPKIAELYAKGDFKDLEKLMKQASKLSSLISLPIVILLIVFSKEILAIFGQEFCKANLALVLLSLGQLVNVVSGSVGYFLLMTNNEKTLFKIAFISLIGKIVLATILIPNLGILGAALANMVTLMSWNLLSVLYIKKKYGFYTFPI